MALSHVQVLQLDLTALHNVDAIVHTVNPQLEVKGTATNAIAAAVGPAFASICSQTLARKGGQLTLKEAAMSTLPSACGSQLHCQHVIHAPLPPCSGKHSWPLNLHWRQRTLLLMATHKLLHALVHVSHGYTTQLHDYRTKCTAVCSCHCPFCMNSLQEWVTSNLLSYEFDPWTTSQSRLGGRDAWSHREM